MDSFPVHDRLKARLELVRADLDEVTNRLKDEDLSFAPSEGMRTIGGQLAEIGGTEIQIMAWLKDGKKVPFSESYDFGEQGKTINGMRDALKEVRARTLQHMDSPSPKQIESPVAMPAGWFESLGREAVPPSEVFRSIAAHEWYHVGQLVSYLWSRGDDPYEW